MPHSFLKNRQILELAFKLRDAESIEQLESDFLKVIHSIYTDSTISISSDKPEQEFIPIVKDSDIYGYLVFSNINKKNDEIREELELLCFLLAEMMIVYKEKKKSRKLKQTMIESEERYRLLTENATDVVFKTFFPSLGYDYISPSIYNVMGCKPEEFYSNSRLLIELLPEEWKYYFDKKWHEIEDGIYPKFYDYPIIHQITKELRWLHQSNDWIKDESGNLIALQGRIEDITERKNSEKKILAERNKAENYLNIADVILLSLNLSGIVTMINRKGCELLGCSKVEILGKSWIDNFVPERLRKEVREVLYEIENKKTNENLILTKGGEERLIEWHNASIFDDFGNIIGSLSSGNDITDRKQAEFALRESEEKFRALYDNAPLSYQSLNEDGTFLDINPTWLITLGYNREEVIGKNFGDFLHPDWKLHFEKNFPAFKKRGYVSGVEFRIRHKDGSYLDIAFEGCIGYNPDGTFRQTYCVFKDITEQKQAELALREKTAFANKIIDSSAISTWISDEKGTAIQTNSACLEFFGATEEEVLGKYNIFQDEVLIKQGFIPQINRAFNQGEVVDILVDYNFGEVKHVHVENAVHKIVNSIFTPILNSSGKVSNVIVQTIDLTEIKRVEESIRQSEQRYRGLVETINSGVAVYKVLNKGEKGSDYIIQDFNKMALEMEGLRKEDVVGKALSEIRPNIDDYGLIPIFKGVWETGKAAFYPAKFYIDDKYANYYENRVFRIPSGEIVAVYDDVTESKRSELALIESEERYHTLFQNTEEGIIIANSGDFHFEYANPAICSILGYSYDEIVKLSVADIHPEDIVEFAKDQFQKLAVKEINSVKELPFKRKDGAVIYMDCNASIIKIKGEAKLAGFFTDITDRKLADQELVKHREHLEELVKERTKELEDKNAELERFNKLFVGREFRIKELRDKVKALENKYE